MSEFTIDNQGTKIAVNADQVSYIKQSGNETDIFFGADSVRVKESYAAVKAALAGA